MGSHEWVEIDYEMLDAARTSRGGWSRAQLQVLGVPWPPPTGWMRRTVGRRVRRADFETFALLGREAKAD